MLPKYSRLNLKKDFKWVVSGKKIETKNFKLFLRTGENLSPRIGIAVSSKNFRKATERNRVKRLTSAVFESVFTRLSPGINIVALPKRGLLEVKSGDVLLELEEKLRGEKIINQSY